MYSAKFLVVAQINHMPVYIYLRLHHYVHLVSCNLYYWHLISKHNYRYENVKNIASMAIVSHKDCGLDYSPISQMVRSHVKKLANEIDVLEQSEEGSHQRKWNTKNRFTKCNEWD